MAASPYNPPSKLNPQGLSIKTTSNMSPFARQAPRSPQKSNGPVASLDLRTVIGTTTEAQTGLACQPDSGIFAFCAGSAVVLGELDDAAQVSQRFFRAHPTAGAVNPIHSFYDETAPGGTPESRRKSALPMRSGGFGAVSTGSPRRDGSDESSLKPWTSKDRAKATTSVSLTTDGRFLAVGETGYCPRVLIFSTDKISPIDLPLSIITEHSFGVRAVAFSPDSRYLATLGDANDGFLFVWSFDARKGSVKLHSTNKCTANIYHMAWCGDSIVTVGIRHVKIWRIPERLRTSPIKSRGRRVDSESLTNSSPQALLGRNCLLGPLADANFTCVTAISNSEAVVCTDRGQVCLIGGTDSTQEIKISRQIGFGIYAVTAKLSTGKILFGGEAGSLEREDTETIRCLARPARWPSSGSQSPASYPTSVRLFSPCGSPSRISKRRRRHVTALGWLAKHVISIDSNYKIIVLADESENELTSIRNFESHHDPIQGLSIVSGNPDLGSFFTWSPSGKINFWDSGGKLKHSKTAEVENIRDEVDGVPNELKVVQAFNRAECFVCGDRVGVLKVLKKTDWSVLSEVRAHSTEITGVAVYEELKVVLIATCGRDRLVQLFTLMKDPPKDEGLDDRKNSSSEGLPTDPGRDSEAGFLDLLQTMDEHVGAVGHVLFANEGERLLSCSADRTVIVRDRVTKEMGTATSVAYIIGRIITLKSSPTSMANVCGDRDSLVVSTMDRQVLRLNMLSGAQVESFKVTDGEGEESAAINSIHVSKQGSSKCPRLLVGCCSSDKSIRVYDYDNSGLLTRESGHSEGISGLALSEEKDCDSGTVKTTVISTGVDGTIMIWDLTIKPSQLPSTPLQEFSQGQTRQIYDSNGTPSKTPTALHPPLRKVLSRTDLADFSFLDPITKSLTPLREHSPPRIRKKTSRYSLAPNKLSMTESPSLSLLKRYATAGDGKDQADPIRNRSPPPAPILASNKPTNDLTIQLSPVGPREEVRQSSYDGELTHSPSTPLAPPLMPESMPSTPSSRTVQRANNARLRRPPSVPSDLRSQTNTSRGRRKSVTPTTAPAEDPTAISVSAAQSLSRSLRAYRIKISAVTAPEQAREQLQLEEVETELLATLQIIREAKKVSANAHARMRPSPSEGVGSGKIGKANAATESELDELAKLVERDGVS